jgi:hypothetical protein
MKDRKDYRPLDLTIMRNNISDIKSPTPVLINKNYLINFQSPKARINRNDV